MNLIFNGYGELIVNDDELKFKSKISNLNYIELDSLVEEYKEIINKNYILQEYFINAKDFQQKSHYIEIIYNAENHKAYHKLRDVDFEHKIYLYNDLIEIAKFSDKENIKTLWNPFNFYIEAESNKVKGLLFEYATLNIPKNYNNLEGLKDLIIHSLTVNEQRIGKPRYNDFIEKDNHIIEYVEKLLECKNINSIEKLNNETIQVIEENIEKERLALEEKRNNRRIKLPLINSIKKENKDLNSDELKRQKIKQQLLSNKSLKNSNISKDKNDVPVSKRLMDFLKSTAGIATMGAFFVLLMIMYISTDGFAMEDNEQKTDENALNQKLEQETEIKNIYREYVYGNEEKAREQLTALNYKDLKKEDQQLYLEFLVKDEYYTRALSLSEQSAYIIGDQINDDNVTDIERIADNEDNPKLKFYIAMYNEDFQKAIEHADKLDIIDKDTALDITKAYYLTNQKDGFNTFMEKYAPNPDEEENEQKSSNYNNLTEAYAMFSNDYINYNNTTTQLSNINDEISKLEDKKEKSDDEKSKLKSLKDEKENLEEREKEEYNELVNMSISDEESSE